MSQNQNIYMPMTYSLHLWLIKNKNNVIICLVFSLYVGVGFYSNQMFLWIPVIFMMLLLIQQTSMCQRIWLSGARDDCQRPKKDSTDSLLRHGEVSMWGALITFYKYIYVTVNVINWKLLITSWHLSYLKKKLFIFMSLDVVWNIQELAVSEPCVPRTARYGTWLNKIQKDA